ncbi:hypothetical protein E5161_16805 [Cohnella pontilimi]|uniref:Uncharacterized protein n=1 Tax=Cohnella pontilimi TaxID=2564100 RepID=A0A4U0F8M3_9BACL|nr:hypothetical protein [Cohnella pontilimi]TJY40798.1 hypothetical protein E5161_16805 [Cohnella pontilimi]
MPIYKRRIILAVILALLVLVLGFVFLSFVSKVINPNYVVIRNIHVSAKETVIAGNFAESAAKYTGYTVSKKDKKLYIKIKASSFAFGNKSDTFNITIDRTKYGEVNEVYLSNGSIQRKIWPS